jgi:acyl-CoA synthetase (AMP-forming)/AMP-acid ligase II
VIQNLSNQEPKYSRTQVFQNPSIPEPRDPVIQTNVSPTLDGLFRRILARQPDALALLDPLNKQRITGTAPRRLTFAQADQAISALSAHFIEAGLPANSVIGIQLPNTVEFMLTVLAALRAGLIVALLPQLWRQAELTMALNRTGATSAASVMTCPKEWPRLTFL